MGIDIQHADAADKPKSQFINPGNPLNLDTEHLSQEGME